MTRHRLARLKLLAQGAALVGAGAATAGCSKNEPPNINAPYEPTVHANATVQPTPQDSAPPDASAAGPAPATASAPSKPVKPYVNAPAKPR